MEQVARIVVVLFWFTLLLSQGAFAPELDLLQWDALPERSRRRAFRWIWGFLHQAVAVSGDENPAPARRAAYEIADMILPGVARNYERDREAQKQFERRLFKRSPACNVTQKRTQ